MSAYFSMSIGLERMFDEASQTTGIPFAVEIVFEFDAVDRFVRV
jgi:hypothetical protein